MKWRAAWAMAALVGGLGCGSEVVVLGGAGGVAPPGEDVPVPDGDAPPIEPAPAVALPVDACNDDGPNTLLEVGSAVGLAMSDEQLFVADGGDIYDCDGAVWAIPFAGGTPTVVADGLCAPRAIAYRDGAIFFVRHSGYVTPNGTLERIDLATGDIQTMASGLISPDALAVDEAYVFVGAEVSEGLQSDGKVVRVARDGWARLEIARTAGNPAAIVTDGSHVFWSASVAFLNGNENHDSAVWRATKDGVESEPVLEGLAWPRGLAMHGDRLVVAHNHDGEILSVRRDGSDAQVLETGLSWPSGLALGGEDLFVAEAGAGDAGALRRRGVASAEASVVHVGGVGAPRDVVLGESCVYWTEQWVGDDYVGLVRRAPR